MGKRNIVHAVALSDSSATTSSGATWAILVQPKKINKWFRVETPPAMIIDSHGRIIDATNSAAAILVKIFLGENDAPSVEHKIQDALHDMASSSSEFDSSSSSSSPSSSPWLRDAVGTLQYAALIDNFDVAEFMQVAERSLIQQREESEDQSTTTPLEVDYEGRQMRQASVGLEEKVAAMKHKEKKQGGWGGFWVSHGPHATYGPPRVARERNSWEREDDAYGGLM